MINYGHTYIYILEWKICKFKSLFIQETSEHNKCFECQNHSLCYSSNVLQYIIYFSKFMLSFRLHHGSLLWQNVTSLFCWWFPSSSTTFGQTLLQKGVHKTITKQLNLKGFTSFLTVFPSSFCHWTWFWPAFQWKLSTGYQLQWRNRKSILACQHSLQHSSLEFFQSSIVSSSLESTIKCTRWVILTIV